jgi:osmoprotectant transport system ATP-binding protein
MIELRDVGVEYARGRAALRDINLLIPAGCTTALLGPSGCGKTTTLKVINRLVSPTRGRVLVRGLDIARADAIALRRGIGYVVQEGGLFPHMTARENVEIVPRLLNWSTERRAARNADLFAMVGLAHPDFADRYPAQLSGGQRQRIGLARALAADPDILLMDEPFGALDPITRHHLQDEFANLQRRLRKTAVLVTHDVEEALRLADQVVVMGAGEILQVGDPATIRTAPATEFVARLLAG